MSVYFMLTLSALWLFLEIRLLVRDRNLGKGSTGADHRTRNLNTAATIIALTVPPGAALLRWFAPFAVPWKGLLWAGLVVSILGTALRHWSIAVLGDRKSVV